MTTVTVAGATGWTGRPVAEAVLAASDLMLGGAVSRSAAGRDLGEAWGLAPVGLTVVGDVSHALVDVDVLVSPESFSLDPPPPPLDFFLEANGPKQPCIVQAVIKMTDSVVTVLGKRFI